MDNIKDQLKVYVGKNRQLVVSGLVTISSFAILGFVIIPQLLSYFTVQDEILQINQKASDLEVKAAGLEKIDPVTSQNRLGVVASIIPVEPDVPIAITVLQGVVAKSGLLLEGIGYLPSAQPDSNSFQLSVKVSGTLQNIRSFILELRNAPRVFAIETISLRSVQGNRIEAEIPVSVFYGAVKPKPAPAGNVVLTLTAEEQALLTKLERLIPPVSTSSAQTSPSTNIPTGKSDPFE